MPLLFLQIVKNAWLQIPGLLRMAVLMVGAMSAFLLMLWILMVPTTALLAGDEVRTLQGTARVQARDATRQLILQAAAGTAALSALVFTARSYLLNRRGQQTQRFKDAGEQIGSDNSITRIAGIYALEHVMRESPDDHRVIVEVLIAYIRQHAPRALPRGAAAEDAEGSSLPNAPAPDVQAALTVLGRRPQRDETDLVLDLSGLHLKSVQLPKARLNGVQLQKSCLVGANLNQARLIGADLFGANLRGTQLEKANLGTADLQTSNLRRASLLWAQLEHAKLNNAFLENAKLNRAQMNLSQLSGVHAHETDFTRASMRETYLAKADLRGAFLLETDLTWSDLSATRLEGTTFRNPLLDATNFRGADVAGANFQSANASTATGFTRQRWGTVYSDSATFPPKKFDLA